MTENSVNKIMEDSGPDTKAILYEDKIKLIKNRLFLGEKNLNQLLNYITSTMLN